MLIIQTLSGSMTMENRSYILDFEQNPVIPQLFTSYDKFSSSRVYHSVTLCPNCWQQPSAFSKIKIPK